MQKSKTFKLFSYTEDRCNIRISYSIDIEGKIIKRSNIYFTNGETRDTRSKSFSLFLSHEDEIYTNIRLKIGPYGNILNPGQIYQKLISDSKKYELKMQKHRKKYREEHKNEIRENTLEYERNNKDEIKKRKHKYYLKNKSKIAERIKNYRKNNPDKTALLRQSRRGWGKPIPLNQYFKGSCLHHTHRNGDHKECIFIPKDIHVSNKHSFKNQKSMNKINKLAFEWLVNQ